MRQEQCKDDGAWIGEVERYGRGSVLDKAGEITGRAISFIKKNRFIRWGVETACAVSLIFAADRSSPVLGQGADILPVESMDYRYTRIQNVDPAFLIKRGDNQSQFFNNGVNDFCFKNDQASSVRFDVLTVASELPRFLSGNPVALLRFYGGKGYNLSADNISDERSPYVIEWVKFSGDGSYAGGTMRGDGATKVRWRADVTTTDASSIFKTTCVQFGAMSQRDLDQDPRPKHTIYETLKLPLETQVTPSPPGTGGVSPGEMIIPNLDTLPVLSMNQALSNHRGVYFTPRTEGGVEFNKGVRWMWPFSNGVFNAFSNSIGELDIDPRNLPTTVWAGVITDERFVENYRQGHPRFALWGKAPQGTKAVIRHPNGQFLACSSPTEVFAAGSRDIAIAMPSYTANFLLGVEVPAGSFEQRVHFGIGNLPDGMHFPWLMEASHCMPRGRQAGFGGNRVLLPFFRN